MPGELLQNIARFINVKIKIALIRKLLLCPYCLSGQLFFWFSVIQMFLSVGERLSTVPFLVFGTCGTILTTYILTKLIQIIND
jgi:hypothetical protein